MGEKLKIVLLAFLQGLPQVVHFTLAEKCVSVYAPPVERQIFQLYLGICLITSSLACPTMQPSSMQVKLSNSIAFLSSTP